MWFLPGYSMQVRHSLPKPEHSPSGWLPAVCIVTKRKNCIIIFLCRTKKIPSFSDTFNHFFGRFSTVTDGTLGTSRRDCITTAPSFGCQSSTDCRHISGSHTAVGRFLLQGLRCGWNSLPKRLRQNILVLLWPSTKNSVSQSIGLSRALEALAIMHTLHFRHQICRSTVTYFPSKNVHTSLTNRKSWHGLSNEHN